jgi:hypothetical protein
VSRDAAGKLREAARSPGVAKQNLAPNFECQPDLTMNSYSRRYRQVLTNLFLNSVAHALCLSILAQHDQLAIEAVDLHDSLFTTMHSPATIAATASSVYARAGKFDAAFCLSGVYG